MILNNAPQNEAILSNVGQVGEFRIRNSAKAFSILSSGLYANKIRAIIRELSCNAVDSHVAAGKELLPFDVHLPNLIEPWFSIRDYGIGLDHEQVTNIYTTYFESTKTDSNAFIGALGLGSKSPFSYTDNFTITTIKDGRRGIYTAFINNDGVPSIALMDESQTSDPNGVEVKFSVSTSTDFHKFIDEARFVYKFFQLRPVIHGCKDFKFVDPVYNEKDIITGVHTQSNTQNSIAVMGNIEYPIQVPNVQTSLGDLQFLLKGGLVLKFNIGELEFQASREGLSYVPSTIAAIKNKLQQLNAQLVVHITEKANNIENYWDRLHYLSQMHSTAIWTKAVNEYITNTKFPLALVNTYGIINPLKLYTTELADKYNIKIRAFNKESAGSKCSVLKPEASYHEDTKQFVNVWKIFPVNYTTFVVTDTKRGSFERAKNHWKTTGGSKHANVYVLEAVNKKQKMEVEKFLKDIYNPQNVIYASALVDNQSKDKSNFGKAGILKFTERVLSRRSTQLVWAKSNSLDKFDDNKTYYYLELQHWAPKDIPFSKMATFYSVLQRSGLSDIEIYGVRSSDILAIKNKKNWIELNSYIRGLLQSIDTTKNVLGLVKESIDFRSSFKYTEGVETSSPYYQLYAEFKDVDSVNVQKNQNLEMLMKAYKIEKEFLDPTAIIEIYKTKVNEIKSRYPMLRYLSYSFDQKDVADYINMVDKVKGI